MADLAKERQQYHNRKAQGLCPHCGKRRPYPGMVSCLDCRKRHRGYTMHFNDRQRELKRQGLTILRCPCRKRAFVVCRQCEAPLCETCADAGGGLCGTCCRAGAEAGSPLQGIAEEHPL
jgi:hypothetical protein